MAGLRKFATFSEQIKLSRFHYYDTKIYSYIRSGVLSVIFKILYYYFILLLSRFILLSDIPLSGEISYRFLNKKNRDLRIIYLYEIYKNKRY